MIALITYGNRYLQTGYLPENFYPANFGFKYCRSVSFIEQVKVPVVFNLFKKNTVRVAENPINWFLQLSNNNCSALKLHYSHSSENTTIKDYLMAGFVDRGGIWYIEAIYKDDKKGFWVGDWKTKGTESSHDDKIWIVRYNQVSLKNKPGTAININELFKKLGEVLKEIADFAISNKNEYYANVFLKSLDILKSPNPEPNEYYPDMFLSEGYSLTAKQLFFASCTAWVFGGMGTWNDIGYNTTEAGKRHAELSEKLFELITKGIVVSVNSISDQL